MVMPLPEQGTRKGCRVWGQEEMPFLSAAFEGLLGRSSTSGQLEGSGDRRREGGTCGLATQTSQTTAQRQIEALGEDGLPQRERRRHGGQGQGPKTLTVKWYIKKTEQSGSWKEQSENQE